jgi:excisionase family DNA binding protein
MDKEFYTIEETAELLRVSRVTIYAYFKAGLRYHKLGRSVRIRREDLLDFIDKRKINGSIHKGRKVKSSKPVKDRK